MSKFIRRTLSEHQKYKRAAMRANQIVCRAIKSGMLPSLKKTYTLCVDCQSRAATCYEHRDYGKPLEVEPVCATCNALRGPAILTVTVTQPEPIILDPILEQELIKEPDIIRFIAAAAQQCRTQKEFARHIGVSPQYLTDLLSGRRPLGAKVAKQLGLELIVTYQDCATIEKS